MAALGARCFASALKCLSLPSLTTTATQKRFPLVPSLMTEWPSVFFLLVSHRKGLHTSPPSCRNDNNLSRTPRKVHNVQLEDENEWQQATKVVKHNQRKRVNPLARTVQNFEEEGQEDEEREEGGHFKKDPSGLTVYPTAKGEVRYKRLTSKDNTFITTMKSVKDRDRHGAERIVLEGRRLIDDATQAGVKVEKIFFCHVKVLDDLDVPEGAEFFKVYDRSMKTWSDLTTPPGILAVCQKPDIGAILDQQTDVVPLIVLCDNVRDPGNMGAIMRSVAAAGCKLLITTTGCVNVWDGKVLRSASGAHFHLPVYHGIHWPYLRNYLPEDFQVLLADNVGAPFDYDQPPPAKPRQVPRDVPDEVGELEETTEVEVDESGLLKDDSYSNPRVLEKYANIKLPTEVFPNVRFSPKVPTVLIIGGETQGISAASRKLAYDYDGKFVSLPLCNNIESLNSGVACGILAYEMRRQISALDR